VTDRAVARELARQSLAQGDPVGWFEQLYSRAETEKDIVPWADRNPNPLLVRWKPKRFLRTDGARALVVGCGYGDDAEWLSAQGLSVTAFDVSPTAVAAARRRFPRSSVTYCVADAIDPPAEWRKAFDLVVEAFTLQVLPPPAREGAAAGIASCAKGTLLLLARGRDEGEPPGSLPWPLTREEVLSLFGKSPGLEVVSFEDLMDEETPPVRRFRVEILRTA